MLNNIFYLCCANGKPIETKKRSRDAPVKAEKKFKEEVVKEEDEDEDGEPVLKRARRAVKTEVEDEDEDELKASKSKSKTKPASKKSEIKEEEDGEPISSKSKSEPKLKPSTKPASKNSESIPPSPAKKAKKEPVKEEEDDIPESKSNVKDGLERRASNASESASEIEEEMEESDEDEKPEVAAKAREKIQTTLKAKTKDPYPDWKPGEPVPYAALCTTFSLIEMTTKRLIIASHCSLFLRQVLRLTPDDMLPTVLLMINKLAADYAGIELGIGESLIMKAIGESTGRSLAVIKQDQKEIGDLGLVAVKSRANQPTMFKPKALTVRGVHKGLMDIATVSGNGAQGRKVDLIKKLLSSADGHTSGKVDITKDKGGPSEAKYLVRFLEGKLRLGLAEKTVLVSLAQAMVCHETEAEGSGKVPSTEQLAKGEAILKEVHR